MSSIFLIEGPVGAGKSTYATRLSNSQRAPHLDLDEWMVNLFSPDRPEEGFVDWYTERKQRCIQQIWLVAEQVLESGSSVVLELGLVQTLDREAFYHRVDGTDYTLDVRLLDTPLEERRRRVLERNAKQAGTFKMEVSEGMFEIANSFWQAPSMRELQERNIQVVTD